MAEFTPMMQHYLQTKEEYKDCILFYRLGDFYEMFFDDAVLVSKELELTLTGKSCGMEERAPMCGIPYHAVEGYLNRLVANGHKVAICEQVEDPKLAKGIVKREVIRVVTPGTNMDIQALDESKNKYIMCIVYLADKYGISLADVLYEWRGSGRYASSSWNYHLFSGCMVLQRRDGGDNLKRTFSCQQSGGAWLKRLCIWNDRSRGIVKISL